VFFCVTVGWAEPLEGLSKLKQLAIAEQNVYRQDVLSFLLPSYCHHSTEPMGGVSGMHISGFTVNTRLLQLVHILFLICR